VGEYAAEIKALERARKTPPGGKPKKGTPKQKAGDGKRARRSNFRQSS